MNSSAAPEGWLPVPDEPGFAVSDHGRVIGPSLRVLKPYTDADGYLRVGVRKTSALVHRWVARAFLGECPEGMEVAHKDHDRTNPRLTNLEYLTHADNVKATAAAGRSMRGEAHVCASMTEETAREILRRYEPGKRGRGLIQPNSAKALAREFGLSSRAVHCLVRRETWTHLETGSSPKPQDLSARVQ